MVVVVVKTFLIQEHALMGCILLLWTQGKIPRIRPYDASWICLGKKGLETIQIVEEV